MAERKLPIEDISTQTGANCFLLGLCFNQTIKAEQAWLAPTKLMERLGTGDISAIAKMDYEQVREVIKKAPALHPFSLNMAKNIVDSCQILVEKYNSDARNIWKDGENCGVLISKLTEFRGIGRHKAVVGIFLLTVEFEVQVFQDDTELNVSKECSALASIYAPISQPILQIREYS